MNIKSLISPADVVSLMNVSSGFLSIIMASTGNLILAAKFMLLAVIFDALDGWVARKTKKEDNLDFGKNIDSLSDVVSFGVAPAMLLYSSSLTFNIQYINILVALLIVICGVLRLSRFNIITDSSDKKFVGLPIPTTALILGSFYLSGIFMVEIALIIMTAVSLLMISTIKYPKFKGIKIVAMGSILIFATLMPPSISSAISYIPAKLLFIATLLYLISIPIISLVYPKPRSGPKC